MLRTPSLRPSEAVLGSSSLQLRLTSLSALSGVVHAKRLRVGIVGAGIGSLTLALALHQRGLAADGYEQALSLREIGAAVV
jgi:hypothetical protein